MSQSGAYVTKHSSTLPLPFEVSSSSWYPSPWLWLPSLCAHEKGYKCIYYNFCRRCLIFNPRDRKYKDLALTKHLCNYGITDMPKQKAKPIKKEEIIPEQVMDPQRIARLEAQQAQVNAMEAANEATMVSTSNLHFALQPPTNMICYRQGSLKRRNASAKRRKPKPGRRIPEDEETSKGRGRVLECLVTQAPLWLI